VFALAGMVQNPRTGYREAIIGGGWQADPQGALTLAAANTSGGWFAQVYALPSVRVGSVTLDATVEGYLPLGGRGVGELDISPAVALIEVAPAAGVGAAYHLSAPAVGAPGYAADPALRVTVAHCAATLELLRGIARASSELRFTIKTSR